MLSDGRQPSLTFAYSVCEAAGSRYNFAGSRIAAGQAIAWEIIPQGLAVNVIQEFGPEEPFPVFAPLADQSFELGKEHTKRQKRRIYSDLNLDFSLLNAGCAVKAKGGFTPEEHCLLF